MQVLCAVVDHGSVSGAATALGYTPSAVSQQVATLERETGTALLERIGRGVRPTAAGLLLAGHAAAIDRQIAEAGAALADLRAGRSGSLTVRYFATAGAALVAPAVAAFRREYPGVRLDLGVTDPEDPLTEVRDGRADLAVLVRPEGAPGATGLRLVHLRDDPYRAVLPRGHRLAARRVLDLAELAEEPWVGAEPPGPCREIVRGACDAAGFRPATAVDSSDYPTAQGFVAAGLGVALVPELGLAQRHPGVSVRRLRGPAPVRALHAAVRESAWGQPVLGALVAALRVAAGSPAAPDSD
ncbi:LysR family transcriptional regulator [Streptomyces sp. FH025]|uniref:LysR family transcriptional regulator n=1 Tax=Streptomyces sp. FH025 TaxID=2815937 RepID=UPI001A9E964F|nr:LysR family transcriptional regulator [Streptomyces sp. FH025]MBO1416724.1 LysR family transcriptional regulator [Streptomyces sp. FH025]